MNFNFFSTFIEHTEKEKRKDFRNVVIVQSIIIILGMVMSSFMDFKNPGFLDKIGISVFSAFGAIYTFLLWDLLKDFTGNRKLVTIVLIALFIITILGLLGEFPFYKIIEFQNRTNYLLFLHGVLFPIEIIVIAFAIRDLFSGKEFTASKLWGAACVYLMIGITFGSLYDIINMLFPQAFGVNLSLGMESYSESIYYSFNILGGLDTDYPEAIKLVRNIAVLEAIWGNLYAILVIGKLLSLPKLGSEKP